jgi:trigger factor
MEVQTSIEDVSEIQKKIKVCIPAARIAKEVETELGRIAKQGRFKGFRQGKTPVDLVRRMHGEEIRVDVSSKLISSTLDDVVNENKLRVAGRPEIDLPKLDAGKDIQYEAVVYLYPSPTIKKYESVKVTVAARSVTDSDIDKLIERMRESRASVTKVEGRDITEKGDVVDATAVMIVDGKEQGRPEPTFVQLDDQSLPKGLADGIVGMKPQESKEISATLPADHPREDLRNKDVIFKVTLNTIYTKKLPELNDEFAATIGGEAVKTLADLRGKAREMLEKENKNAEDDEAKGEILKVLMEDHSFPIPQNLVDAEIRNILVENNLVDPQKTDPERVAVESLRDKLGEAAQKRVKTRIIMDGFCEAEKVEVKKEDIDKWFTELFQRGQISENDVRDLMTDRNRMLPIFMEIRRSKGLEVLVSRAEITRNKKE